MPPIPVSLDHHLLISVDCETYGSCRRSARGIPLPPQTCFHPARAVAIDGCRPSDLLACVALTLCPTTIPRTEPLSIERLASLKPGPTMVLLPHNPEHRDILGEWLSCASILLGMHLTFDLLFLRTLREVRHRTAHQTLIDLSTLSFSHSDTRPERSLDALGPVLGTHAYTEEEKRIAHRGAASPLDPTLHDYNAKDTHYTLIAAIELARLICRDFGGTVKTTHSPISWYSDVIRTVLSMSESGIPLSTPALTALESDLLATSTTAASTCNDLGLTLEGSGSDQAKRDLLVSLASELTPLHPNIWSDPPLELTEKQAKLSWSGFNRTLLRAHLPPNHRAHTILSAAESHATAQKIVSTYTYPLLRHHRKKPADRTSLPVPNPTPGAPATHIAYPSWFLTPSRLKGADISGGTRQSRLTCKSPSAQTWPPPVKACMASRHPRGTLLSVDLSQIELRVAALLSGEPALTDAFLLGHDLHSRRALSIFGEAELTRLHPELVGVPIDQWRKASPSFAARERQIGKTIGFSDLFLSAPARQQRTVIEESGTHYPLSFFQNVVATRTRDRPLLSEWQYQTCCAAERDGHLILPFTGHHRSFFGLRVDHDRWHTHRQLRAPWTNSDDTKNMIGEAVNFPIQTTAANVQLALQATLLSNHLPHGVHLFLQIYDAIYLDCPPGTEPAVRTAIAAAFSLVSDHEDGYWSRLCTLHQRRIPLTYDLSALPSPSR